MLKIEEKHHRAARSLANGNTEKKAATAAGVSPASIARWKRRDEFKALIHQYSEPLRTAIESANAPDTFDLFELIPKQELAIIADLQRVVEKLGSTVLKRLGSLSDDEVGEIPTRLIPSFVKCFIDATDALQKANDRRSGYELIVNELEKIIEKDNRKKAL
jgi:transposase